MRVCDFKFSAKTQTATPDCELMRIKPLFSTSPLPTARPGNENVNNVCFTAASEKKIISRIIRVEVSLKESCSHDEKNTLLIAGV